MKNSQIKIIKALLFIGISIYIAVTFNDSLTNMVNKAPIGWVLSSIILRVVISLSFARGVQLIINSLRPKIKSALVFIPATFIGFGMSFAAQPIFTTDYGDFSQQEMILDIDGLTSATYNEFNLNNKAALVIFFTTDCPHCKEASVRLNYLYKNGHTPQVICIYPGTEEDTRKFIDENNGDLFTHHIINDDDFFRTNCGESRPSFYLIDENGETISHWFNEGLNYNALDLIKKYK